MVTTKQKQTTQRGIVPAGDVMRAQRSTAEKCPGLERGGCGAQNDCRDQEEVSAL
jgi:hypothetical protein